MSGRMKPSAYTISILIPDGDPEGVRIITRFDWTGTGTVFQRPTWHQTKNRPEFERPGVYILVGPDEQLPDLQRVYIGEGDAIKERIDEHVQKKDFWTWGVAFTSNAGNLNKAHVKWLESALVQRAREVGRCVLDNGNTPQKPALSEHDEADVHGFLQEILRTLPLAELRVFEKPKTIVTAHATSSSANGYAGYTRDERDTIVVPAQKEGFNEVFLGENAWYAIRISGAMLDRIKYIAAYQVQPVSAITHVAEVKQIEEYGDSGKYKVVFKKAAEAIAKIPFADAASGSMQGPRYTTHEKLLSAKKVSDLF